MAVDLVLFVGYDNCLTINRDCNKKKTNNKTTTKEETKNIFFLKEIDITHFIVCSDFSNQIVHQFYTSGGLWIINLQPLLSHVWMVNACCWDERETACVSLLP